MNRAIGLAAAVALGDCAASAPMVRPQRAEQRLIAGDASEAQQCLAACNDGEQAIEDFCRTLPDPEMRAGCWAIVMAGPVACAGFCYLWFGASFGDISE